MRSVLFLVAVCALTSTARAEGLVKEKVFIPPVRGEGFPKAVLSVVFDLVVVAVDRAQVMNVVTLDDVQEQLDQEKRKDALGCSSVACAVEFGGALGVRYLLATRVKKLAKDIVITASLIDTREQKSKNGQGRAKNDESEYDKAVQAAVAEALGLVTVSLSAPTTSATPATKEPASAPAAAVSSPTPEPAGIEWVHSAPAGIDLAKTETTVAQYRACVEAGECGAPGGDRDCNWHKPDRAGHPINCVDWNQSTAFCAWAGGRLPTEDEWYAEALNRKARAYPWGNQEVTCDYAIWGDGDRTDGCGKNSTWPVCSKTAGNSVSGLCDMGGNVWEWTSTSAGAGPVGGAARVLRGGSWINDNPEDFRAGYHLALGPRLRRNDFGFRCGRSSP